MGMGDATKVSAGKPNIDGAIYRAPLGTTLPTNATSALGSAFKNLGYVSEDGATNTLSNEASSQKAWGGDNVLNMDAGNTDEIKYKLLETLNVDVLKAIYGADKVTESSGAIAIEVAGVNTEQASWVVEMILTGNRIKRIVIPSASITALEDIIYKDTEAAGYGLTLTAVKDTDGNSHYEYISAPPTTGGSGGSGES